jgi:hypothetical protein
MCRDCALRFKRKGSIYLAPTKKTDGVQFLGTRRKIVTALAVREHLLDAGHVGLAHQSQLLELAHAAGRFGSHQVALAGVAAQDLAVGGDLEALPRATVRLQFQFWFRSVSRHDLKSSRDFDALHASSGVSKFDRGHKLGRGMLPLEKAPLRF